MGFRFRKSITIAPGLRLNLTNKSSSVSIGVPGFRHTIGAKGKRTTVGLPGTGISYSVYTARTPTPASSTPQTGNRTPLPRWFGWGILFAAMIFLAMSFLAPKTTPKPTETSAPAAVQTPAVEIVKLPKVNAVANAERRPAVPLPHPRPSDIRVPNRVKELP